MKNRERGIKTRKKMGGVGLMYKKWGISKKRKIVVNKTFVRGCVGKKDSCFNGSMKVIIFGFEYYWNKIPTHHLQRTRHSHHSQFNLILIDFHSKICCFNIQVLLHSRFQHEYLRLFALLVLYFSYFICK